MQRFPRITQSHRPISTKIAITVALTTALSLSVLTIGAPPASATGCEIKACIDVYIQDGRIVIEGRKGSGPSSSRTTIPAPAISPKPKATPKPKITPKPKPSEKPTPIATRQRSKVAPTVKKPPKKSTSQDTESGATSLSDKLIESIPTSGIAYQPSFSPLIRTPVFFWSDVPKVITKKVEMLGEVVNVRLRPIFIWHYGDGIVYMTREVGAAYPDGKIQHTYSKPGHYLIELVTSWSGEFTINGVTALIPGKIVTVSVLPITVVAAPIRFVN